MYFNEEKICLITGANSGTGKATALGLAKLGATLILVSRNRFRSEKVLEELISVSGNQKINLFITDLSVQQEIKSLCKQIISNYNKLDILINNAGVYYSKKHLTIDGIEATFAVNYLSRFLMTNLLLPLIYKSKHARIIEVAGEYHRYGKIDFDDLQKSRKYCARSAVEQSKLANVLFAYELSRRLKKRKITVNCLHPGFVATNIIYNDPDSSIIKKIAYKMARPFMLSPEKGAETILYLASSPEVNNVTGRYFIKKKCVESSPASYNKELSLKLWKISERLCGLSAS